MPSLAQLLASGSPPEEIEAHLDEIDHAARVAEVRALKGKELARLHDLCAGREVGLDHFVPPSVADGVPVRHHGINSLPFFRKFEKRFLRAPGKRRLHGYNHQALAAITGPGYFVVEEPPAGTELAIDYYQIPETRPHPDWPALRGNEGIPTRFVYGFMKDFMRRVSRHVSIGRAHRKGEPQSAWFALVRED